MVEPLTLFGGHNLREMLDSDMSFLSYKLRVGYANQLNSNGQGSLYVGTGIHDSIGELSDTIATLQFNSQARNNSGGGDWPSAPGIGVSEHTLYKYKQKRVLDSNPWPVDATWDAHSFVSVIPPSLANHNDIAIVGGTSGKFGSEAAEGLENLFNKTIYEMRDSGGDQVGTYKVSVSTPSGDPNWVDKGTWFMDNTYSAADTTYKLWLKTKDSSVPGRFPHGPIKLHGGHNLKEMDSNEVDNLVENCLVPAFTRWSINNSKLDYHVMDSGGDGHHRGNFFDTRQTSTTDAQVTFGSTPPGASDTNVYYTTSTPTGSAVMQGKNRNLMLNNDSS